jgi:hypothetical protein
VFLLPTVLTIAEDAGYAAGEAALYRGQRVAHWRKNYAG